ncbi:cupin domain-containing protein [Mesorhizobium sp. LHD-90]|uniref:cupin domain-containing protein n=1 Tax=Mesorhizobium sp. LHD-90 TaxID=3071414 RepID=UPI0027E06406|nr:cupin domain-containing protein [Mesorhizobium sp. LHD-90]MDQ6433061.1 cupin domain-containing protein [Mesorhizobium sp. LHD-90]
MTAKLFRDAGAGLAFFGAVAFAWPALALDPAPQSVVVTPLASTNVTAAGQPIVLPAKDARVIVSNFEIAPGATLPVHKHPYQRYAYVLAGALRVTNAETGESTDYKPGDFIVEMVGRWHQGANIGTDTVRLLVIDQVEGDLPNTLLKQ